MDVKIEKGVAKGRIAAPPSKSMAHRYLICAALSGGSTVSGVAFSEDIKATLGCLKALGAEVKIDGVEWTARSEDGSVIEKGAMVRIVKIEGVKVFVVKDDDKNK